MKCTNSDIGKQILIWPQMRWYTLDSIDVSTKKCIAVDKDGGDHEFNLEQIDLIDGIIFIPT